MRLIDANELKIDYGFTWDDITPTHEEMYALIDRQPTIDAVPVKHGRWISYDSDSERYDDIRCSNCGKNFTVDAERYCDIGFVVVDLKFCPNCGADMRERKES